MSWKLKFPLIVAAFLTASAAAIAAGTANDACALLTPADISKVTGLKVGSGVAGKPIPGILAKCTWTGQDNTRVIVTLGDARHIEITVRAAEATGGQSVPGLGTKAVGMKGAAFTGGGYIVNVLDAKGGFGVSILGQKGTRDGAIALAKMVESHR
ncbi:MAG TPA: hypothetical protein VGR93_11160 [Candidatus Acidoferrales bacterium]|nr:hypothetical protein [Candidatus Acidoferrales bacterium]